MKLKFLGHSCFELTESKNILIDPFISGNPAAPGVELKPDIIAVTHAHSDHFGDTAELAVKHKCKVVSIHEISKYLGARGIPCEGMNKGGTITIDGVDFTMTEAVHSSSFRDFDGGCPAGFVIRDKTSVYHAGDTALFWDMKLIKELYHPEIALLPIGDRYTMGIREAATAASWLNPKIVVPMHYGTYPSIKQSPQEFAERVLSLCDSEVVILKPGEGFEY
ncbi:MAG: metal-dependent hydrolase [Candidatus Methanoperedens sp.]|jgi:L-ascorbate metabolism protein UlaG (beta-lactamase superfamily)|nr:metal-dependent hydrolase [Candidatus Methanoperedens sp.]PKL53182.1 MAG: metal-dependent hydrolase [Candidatus Methanoperedenaceae archaeon HGW-Methanoperedenaceae-1]